MSQKSSICFSKVAAYYHQTPVTGGQMLLAELVN